MPEIIRLLDIEPDYSSDTEEAIINSGFSLAKVDPELRQENSIPPPPAGGPATNAHIFTPPLGSEMKDIGRLMEERMFRSPIDLREVLALGREIKELVCRYVVYAPRLTQSTDPNTVLKIMRFEGWSGLGLAVSTIDPDDDDYPYNYQFIGFSVGRIDVDF